VDQPPENPPPLLAKPVILSYARVLVKNEVTVETDGVVVRYVIPPRIAFVNSTMVILFLTAFLVAVASFAVYFAMMLLQGTAGWIVSVLLFAAIVGLTRRALYFEIRTFNFPRVIQADARGLMVSYADSKGPAFRTINRADIRNVWVRPPTLGRTWRLWLLTRQHNYTMEFRSPPCPAMMGMQETLRKAMELPQDQQAVPFCVTSRPLDR
jgi:cell division protein FtsW (lipid II flippase)